jgi:hypothetical protein
MRHDLYRREREINNRNKLGARHESVGLFFDQNINPIRWHKAPLHREDLDLSSFLKHEKSSFSLLSVIDKTKKRLFEVSEKLGTTLGEKSILPSRLRIL